MKAFVRPIVALCVATSAAAQEGPAPTSGPTESDYARVVEQAVSDYILPAYQDLQAATGEFGPAVSDLCVMPWPIAMVERDFPGRVFASTVEAWAGVDFFRFGPMARDGRYERFAFWPDMHGTGARQLRRLLATEDEALLSPSTLREQSAAIQGLPTLDSLFYSGSKALTTAEERDDYRCRLALSIVANLNRIAIEALEGWRSTWASLIREPGPDNPVYRTHKEAMTEVLKAILTGLEQMRDHRLRPALGETAEQARAGRAPYNASGQALPYLRASAEALQEFVVASGILSLVPEDKGWIENSVAFEFANLKRALDAAGPDLEAALADTGKYQKLAYAEIVLQSLHDLFQRQLAPAAGLTQGFNSLDGD